MHELVAKQADTCEPTGSAPSIRCSSCTRRARPASRRASSTATGGYLLWAMLTMQLGVRHQADRRLLVHRRHRLGDRPYLHHLRSARGRRHRGRVRGHPDVSGCRPLLEDDPGAQGDDLLHGAHGDPLADQGSATPNRADAITTCRACACSARSASRSIRRRGCGTTTNVGRRALSHRRHVVADRDRRPHDLADAGRHAARSRIVHVGAARASWRRSSTRPATTSRTARAASW